MIEHQLLFMDLKDLSIPCEPQADIEKMEIKKTNFDDMIDSFCEQLTNNENAMNITTAIFISDNKIYCSISWIDSQKFFEYQLRLKNLMQTGAIVRPDFNVNLK